MKKLITPILSICACAFFTMGVSQCSTTGGTGTSNIAAFFANKTVQQIGAGVLNIALSAGIQAGTQEASTGTVNGSQIASSAEYGAVALLRSLQGTPNAANPAAITTAITTGANTPATAAIVAPQIAGAVTAAVSAGMAPSAANEAAAVGLSTAASTLTTHP